MNTATHLKNPARETLDAFRRSGVSMRRIAGRLGVAPSTVKRWPDCDEGAGNIPSRYHRRLLDLARETGAAVTAGTLINGS